MKFYAVSSIEYISGEGEEYFATKAEAMREARSLDDPSVTVFRVELGDTSKAGIIALANGRGWCASRVLIYSGPEYDPNFMRPVEQQA